MDTQNNFKKSIWIGMCASFLMAVCILLLVLPFFKPYHFLDHPLKSEKLSLLDKVLIVNYMLIFAFLVFLIPSLFIPLVFRKQLRICIFLFWALVIIFLASFIHSKILTIPTLRNLLLNLFYILLSIAIFLIYNWIYRAKILQRVIISTIVGIIVLSTFGALFNFDEMLLLLLNKKNILLLLNILIILGLAVVFSWLFFYKLLLWMVNKIICLMNKKQVFIYIKVLAILLIVSISTAVLSYLWENRKTSISYEDVASTTTKDVNVILIVIDTLRADHLGCYGYKRQTSPAIDSLANEGVLFRHCYSPSSWTKTSVASILTSLYPPIHGLTSNFSVLPEKLTTLAEILQAKGYVTYGYVTVPCLKAKFNFNQGFDFFDDYLMRDKLYYVALRYLKHIASEFIGSVIKKSFRCVNMNNIKLANKRIISWLSKYRHENFFMYIHYIDPHAPYAPPAPYNRMYPYLKEDANSKSIALYDGEIRFVDDHLGNFFERLKSWGIYDKTIMIITADHGEGFGEHNDQGHSHAIYQEHIKVPLIIKFNPSMPRGKIIESQVRSIDIMPTILDILDVSYAGSLEGKSLLPLIRGEEGLEFCNDIFVEERRKEYLLKGIIRNNEWKLIFTEKSALRNVEKEGQIELYSLKEDPNELHNLATLEPEVLKSMLDKLTFFITHCQKKAITPVETELDSETIEQLRSLGYLQ